MSDTTPTLSATIHVGASAISMLVLETSPEEEPRVIEFMEKTVPLAHDIFGEGKVSRSTIELSVSIVQGFLDSLIELGGDEAPVWAVTTNILSEAKNADIFLNRLRIACSLDMETLDDGEMTRLIYLKTRRRLQDTPSMKTRRTLVLHIGPGNTRALLFDKGHIIRYNSYRLGTHRTWEAIDSPDLRGETLVNLISQHAASHITQIYYDFLDDKIQDMVIIGQEIQLLNPFLKKAGQNETMTKLSTLRSHIKAMSQASENERVRNYQLDYQTAEGALPALVINHEIAQMFELKKVHIPESDYDRGLLIDLSQKSTMTNAFRDEVLRSAEHLALRYQASIDHGQHVAHLSEQLFEQSQDLHSLNERDKLLLHIASLLHECGNYISSRQHEIHSLYIIQNSEIFGLSHKDKVIVALIARYHRSSSPSPHHEVYRDLDTCDRIRVAKLASLIRIADALERGHGQRIKDLELSLTKDKAQLTLRGITDAATERLAMQSKGDLFENLFGLSIVIQETP